MRNPTLHDALAEFTREASAKLTTAAGEEEIPFEVVSGGGNVPLYCYRPLTGEFIRARLGLLVALPSYVPAARALEGVGGVELYLRARGVRELPSDQRVQIDDALYRFLARVFEERSEFGFDDGRFDSIYVELENALYEGRCVTEFVAPILGVDLDGRSDELAIGEGLSLVRARSLGSAPEAYESARAPVLLIVLRIAHDPNAHPSAQFAQSRFKQVLSALRLYERGTYAIGQLGYRRIDDGAWVPVAIGQGGRARQLTLIPADSEDELRAFCNLIARRLPVLIAGGSGDGEIVWALQRFEMGCERDQPLQALSDYLLAARALLEPEGPSSGRLAQRLTVICAGPDQRSRMAMRMARAVALERAVISGLAGGGDHDVALVEELADHLRAILRDVLCGHLDADVRTLADELLADAAGAELTA